MKDMKTKTITDLEIEHLQNRLLCAELLLGKCINKIRSHRFCGDAYPENGWPDMNSLLGEYAIYCRAKRKGSELWMQSLN